MAREIKPEDATVAEEQEASNAPEEEAQAPQDGEGQAEPSVGGEETPESVEPAADPNDVAPQGDDEHLEAARQEGLSNARAEQANSTSEPTQ